MGRGLGTTDGEERTGVLWAAERVSWSPERGEEGKKGCGYVIKEEEGSSKPVAVTAVVVEHEDWRGGVQEMRSRGL
jgi:hypothetical protein